MTIAATLPVPLARDEPQAELEPRDPVREFTMTMKKSSEIPISTSAEFTKISVPAITYSFNRYAPKGIGGWRWTNSSIIHSQSSTEFTTPVTSLSYTSSSTHPQSSTEPTIPVTPPSYTEKTESPLQSQISSGVSSTCPALKPILEITCVDRSRLLWNDFKITWGPAWDDYVGCRRLYREMDKRGLVTGFHCSQVADVESNTWIMEARGHRPRFPKTFVADAIRATFEAVSIHLFLPPPYLGII